MVASLPILSHLSLTFLPSTQQRWLEFCLWCITSTTCPSYDIGFRNASIMPKMLVSVSASTQVCRTFCIRTMAIFIPLKLMPVVHTSGVLMNRSHFTSSWLISTWKDTGQWKSTHLYFINAHLKFDTLHLFMHICTITNNDVLVSILQLQPSCQTKNVGIVHFWEQEMLHF